MLNRAIVIAEIEGPAAGIRALHETEQESALRHYHLFDATLGELYRRSGDLDASPAVSGGGQIEDRLTS